MTTKQQVNLRLWLIAIKRRLRDEPAGPRQEFLCALLVEVHQRLAQPNGEVLRSYRYP